MTPLQPPQPTSEPRPPRTGSKRCNDRACRPVGQMVRHRGRAVGAWIKCFLYARCNKCRKTRGGLWVFVRMPR